jgi:hypothetical protein
MISTSPTPPTRRTSSGSAASCFPFVRGAAPYAELRDRAERIELDGNEIRVAAFDDLMR